MNTQLQVLTLIAAMGFCGAAVSGQGTWETTLQGRDLDGNLSDGFEAYYDTALNVTWLANANYAQTSGYVAIGVLTNGAMIWSAADTWVAGLNFNGITGWRLPTVTDTGTSGCNYAYTGTDCGYNVNTATGEVAHMFYTTLGNKAYYNTSGIGPQTGWGLTNTGPFSNVQSYYWSGTEYAPNTSLAWDFSTYYGGQDGNYKSNHYFAWAVHSGDVGAVPVPAAAWLFGSGLLGLIGVARRKKK